MTQRIVYKRDDGGISLVIPNLACGLTIEEIAAKDVPTGKPYKIVDIADLPSEPQELWTVDDADLNDGVGA